MSQKDQDEVNPFAIHAVLIKSSVPMDEAKTHAENILKKKVGKIRATKTMYRFRNIPKTKFEPKSFRSKKVNDTITLVFGNLKPQFGHMKGAGMFDFLSKGVEKAKDLVKKGVEKGKEFVEKAKKKIKDRGTTLLTGTNYAGPFNRTDEEYQRLNPPTDQIDRGALEHDLTYEKIAKKRDSGQISRTESDRLIRESDDKFLKNIRDNYRENPWASVLSYAGIAGKNLAEDYLGVDRNKFVTGSGRGRRRDHSRLFTHPLPLDSFRLISDLHHHFNIPMKRMGGAKDKRRKPYKMVVVPLYGKSGMIMIKHPRGHMTGGGFFSDLWDGVKSGWNSLTNAVTDTWNTVSNTVSQAATNAWEGIKDVASQGWETVKEGVSDVWNDLTSGVDDEYEDEDEEEEDEEDEPEGIRDEEEEEEEVEEEKKADEKVMRIPTKKKVVVSDLPSVGVASAIADMGEEMAPPTPPPAPVLEARPVAQRILKQTAPQTLGKMAALTNSSALERNLANPSGRSEAYGDGKRRRGRPSKMK